MYKDNYRNLKSVLSSSYIARRNLGIRAEVIAFTSFVWDNFFRLHQNKNGEKEDIIESKGKFIYSYGSRNTSQTISQYAKRNL